MWGLLWRYVVAGLLVLTLTVLPHGQSQPIPAQTACFRLTREYCDAVQAIAQYMVPPVSGGNLDVELLRLGFKPDEAMPIEKWRALPPFIKLEVAYWAAERQKKGSGRTLLLALRKRLQSTYNTATYVETWAALLDVQSPSIPFSGFRYVPENLRPPGLPDEIKKVILSIADLCCHQTYEFTTFVSTRFQTTLPAVYGLLEVHRGDWASILQALTNQYLGQMGEARLFALFKAIVRDLDRRNVAARHDPRLDPFRGEDPPAAAAAMPTGPIPPGSPPASTSGPPPKELDKAAREYVKQTSLWNEEIKKAVQKSGGSLTSIRSFENAVRNPATAGGVIFGSPVQADVSLGRPVTATFISEGAGRGDLKIQFKTQSGKTESLVLRDVNSQDLLSAYGIYFRQTFGGSNVPVRVQGPEDAVSLIGWLYRTIDDSCNYSEIHPAILYSDIGWSGLYADTFMFIATGGSPYPIDRIADVNRSRRAVYNTFRYNIELLFRTPEDKAQRELLSSRLSNVFPAAKYMGTWKVTDVPTIIGRSKGFLTVEARRRVPESFGSRLLKHPVGLLRSAFLDMRLLTGTEDDPKTWSYDTSFSTSFYGNLPFLLASSREFSRLNEFARTMAVMRWLKASGVQAKAIKINAAPRFLKTPAPNVFKFQNGKIAAVRAEDGCPTLEQVRTELRRRQQTSPVN